jgi:cell division protein FtsW (lipid II flippase)
MAYRLPWDSSRYNWWLLALLIPLCYLGLTFLSHNKPETNTNNDGHSQLSLRALIASWIIVPLLTAYVLSLGSTKIFYFRNLLFIAPALVIALASLSTFSRGIVAM